MLCCAVRGGAGLGWAGLGWAGLGGAGLGGAGLGGAGRGGAGRGQKKGWDNREGPPGGGGAGRGGAGLFFFLSFCLPFVLFAFCSLGKAYRALWYEAVQSSFSKKFALISLSLFHKRLPTITCLLTEYNLHSRWTLTESTGWLIETQVTAPSIVVLT